ncbi:MAG: aldolase/citrate lyase family protein, partial [Eubacteriales bacterium]
VRYGNEDINEYIRYGVFDMARFVQIETAEAVRNLRDIMSVEYIDGFIIGPCDLSASVGELGQDEQPLTVSLIEQICNTLASAGRSFGVSLGDPPDKLLDFYLNLGANIISAGADFSYLLDGAKRMKSKVNAAVSRNDLS